MLSDDKSYRESKKKKPFQPNFREQNRTKSSKQIFATVCRITRTFFKDHRLRGDSHSRHESATPHHNKTLKKTHTYTLKRDTREKRVRMCESCHSLPSLCGTQCERWPQSDYYLFTTSKHYSGKPAEAEKLRQGLSPNTHEYVSPCLFARNVSISRRLMKIVGRNEIKRT